MIDCTVARTNLSLSLRGKGCAGLNEKGPLLHRYDEDLPADVFFHGHGTGAAGDDHGRAAADEAEAGAGNDTEGGEAVESRLRLRVDEDHRGVRSGLQFGEADHVRSPFRPL